MKFSKDSRGYYYIDKKINGRRCNLRSKDAKRLQEKITEWILETAEHDDDTKKGPLFETVANDWWVHAVQTIRPGTQNGYRAGKNFWVQELGDIHMKEIEVFQINNGLARMKGRRLASKTIKNYKAVCGLIFNHWISSAVWRGDRNPVDYASIPSGAKKSETRMPPTDEQIKAVMDHPDGFGFIAWLLAYTGCRLGEANSIQKKDVRLDEECYGVTGCIHIEDAAPWAGNQPIEHAPTKTETSVRIVPIFGPFRSVLEQAIQNLSPDDYIVSGCKKPLTQSQYNARWNDYCASIGIAHHIEEPLIKMTKSGMRTYTRRRWKADVTAHQYRHLFATTCYEAGLDIAVTQRLLGHKDRRTTERIYQHLRDRMMTRSVVALDDYFNSNK